MEEKLAKVKAEVERLKEETSIGLSEHENGVEQGRMEIINALSIFLDSLQEEPVSEDLEIEIKHCIYEPFFDLDGVAIKGATKYLTVEDIADIARHFANWQKEQMMKDAVEGIIYLDVDHGHPYENIIKSDAIQNFDDLTPVKLIIFNDD